MERGRRMEGRMGAWVHRGGDAEKEKRRESRPGQPLSLVGRSCGMSQRGGEAVGAGNELATARFTPWTHSACRPNGFIRRRQKDLSPPLWRVAMKLLHVLECSADSSQHSDQASVSVRKLEGVLPSPLLSRGKGCSSCQKLIGWPTLIYHMPVLWEDVKSCRIMNEFRVSVTSVADGQDAGSPRSE